MLGYDVRCLIEDTGMSPRASPILRVIIIEPDSAFSFPDAVGGGWRWAKLYSGVLVRCGVIVGRMKRAVYLDLQFPTACASMHAVRSPPYFSRRSRIFTLRTVGGILERNNSTSPRRPSVALSSNASSCSILFFTVGRGSALSRGG